jgi:hypothetical protein
MEWGKRGMIGWALVICSAALCCTRSAGPYAAGFPYGGGAMDIRGQACAQELTVRQATACSTAQDAKVPPGFPESLDGMRADFAGRCLGTDISAMDACIQQKHALYAKQDPEAAQRRATARPLVSGIREKPAYRDLAERWTNAARASADACKYADRGEPFASSCEEKKRARLAVGDELFAFLQTEGIDERDVRALGLVPD